jgi:hypothetical protein
VRPAIGQDVVYSALMNSECGVRVKVVAVRERTALVQYADGHIAEVLLTRLSEVPASWNEPQPSICLTDVVTQFAKAGGDVTKLDVLKRKRGVW